MDIRKAIDFGWPGNISRVGETYTSLEWFSPGSKPTEAEVNQAWLDYLAAPPPEPVYPTEVVMQDIGTGEPVRMQVKNLETYLGDVDEEIPS